MFFYPIAFFLNKTTKYNLLDANISEVEYRVQLLLVFVTSGCVHTLNHHIRFLTIDLSCHISHSHFVTFCIWNKLICCIPERYVVFFHHSVCTFCPHSRFRLNTQFFIHLRVHAFFFFTKKATYLCGAGSVFVTLQCSKKSKEYLWIIIHIHVM